MARVTPVVPSGKLSRAPQPVLEADGLRLRPWTDLQSDVELIRRALADPEIQRWFPDARGDMSAAEARMWIAGRRQRWTSDTGADWAVCEDGAVVGRMALVRLQHVDGYGEVAYWTLPEGRGHGVTSRALCALSDWAFSAIGIHRLELLHSVGNPGSCGVAKRSGFRLEGTARQRMLHRDGWHDMHLHARLAGDRPPARD